MLLTTHSLVGAYIGGEINNIPLAFVVGVASHLLLDSIPHADGPDDRPGKKDGEPKSVLQYLFIAFDIVLAILAFYFLWQRQKLSAPVIAGAFGGIFPDLVDNVPFWSPALQRLPGFKQFHAFHFGIQKIKAPLWLGLLTGYTIAAIFFWLILR